MLFGNIVPVVQLWWYHRLWAAFPKRLAMHATPTESPEPFPREPIPPELLAWARQTFDADEFLKGVREIKATGGRTFESLIAEVEALSTDAEKLHTKRYRGG